MSIQIPIPAFEWVTIADSAWNGFLLAWILLGLIQAYLMFAYRRKGADVIGMDGFFNDLLLCCISALIPFLGTYCALESLEDEVKTKKKRK